MWTSSGPYFKLPPLGGLGVDRSGLYSNPSPLCRLVVDCDVSYHPSVDQQCCGGSFCICCKHLGSSKLPKVNQKHVGQGAVIIYGRGAVQIRGGAKIVVQANGGGAKFCDPPLHKVCFVSTVHLHFGHLSKGSDINYGRGDCKIGQNLTAKYCDPPPPIERTSNFLSSPFRHIFVILLYKVCFVTQFVCTVHLHCGHLITIIMGKGKLHLSNIHLSLTEHAEYSILSWKIYRQRFTFAGKYGQFCAYPDQSGVHLQCTESVRAVQAQCRLHELCSVDSAITVQLQPPLHVGKYLQCKLPVHSSLIWVCAPLSVNEGKISDRHCRHGQQYHNKKSILNA